MCDTITVFLSPEHSFFGKNSDRDPAEFQFIYISTDPVKEFQEKPVQYEKEEYLNNSFQRLKEIFPHFDHPYEAIISKPDWIWGAEMGVNEEGLAIGNEAVFSREKAPVDGLLGMDILRLALHNCKDVQEAVTFITELIERYPQGGNGSFSAKLYYQNSFLIKDFKEAVILETSLDSWALKKVDRFATISNAYTIRDDFQLTGTDKPVVNLKRDHEDSLFTFFSRGEQRQRLSSSYLEENDINLKSLVSLLRSHKNNSAYLKRGMTSICMHPGLLLKNETTSSILVEYFKDRFVVWFTGSPNPCVSLYKPMIFTTGLEKSNPFTELEYAYEYCKRWRQSSRRMIYNSTYFHSNFKELRDKVEDKMERKVFKFLTGEKTDIQEIWQESLQIAENYLNTVEAFRS